MGRGEAERMSSHAKPQSAGRFRLGLHPLTAAVLILVLVTLVFAGISRGAAKSAASEESSVPSSQIQVEAESEVGAGEERAPSESEIAAAADSDASSRANGATEGADGAGDLYVFVTGAVKSPGVVIVPAGSRAEQAVLAAGGLSSEAEMTSVNLAALLTDGEHIHVLAVGEAPLSGFAGAGASGSGQAAGGGADTGCVDLNSATAEQLQALDGVGPKISARIVERREAAGGFSGPEELMSVSGIGPTLYERISVGLCQ